MAISGKNIDRKSDLDSGNAFLPDPRRTGRLEPRDSVAALVGQGFVSSATNAEDVREDVLDGVTIDEYGGPFLEVDGSEELADDEDESNPADATKEPFPTAVRAPRS